MTLDWRRLKTVVLQSDDWGLCAWVPDDAAHRALAEQPAFRSEPGRRYGRSTLESAADVRALADTLGAHRGADGRPPLWQANTIVATPDWERLVPPRFGDGPLAVVGLDALPARWARPGLREAYAEAAARGVWWAELHGLHHLPETAWREALRRGDADARAAFAEQSPLCVAVEASGEYDPAESREVRARVLRDAVERFTRLFGRAPASLCPPDYRFDAWLEDQAGALGVSVVQGWPERADAPLAPLRRRWLATRFPQVVRARLRMPPRTAFEPRGEARAEGRVGIAAAIAGARAAWAAGRPAVISTHRLNYAHLDAAWSAAGRAALDALLRALCGDGATFLADTEVAQWVARGWSVRALADGTTLLRVPEASATPPRFAAPAGVSAGRLRAASGAAGEGRVKVEGGTAEAHVGPGTHTIEWTRA